MPEKVNTTERQLNLLAALLKSRDGLGWADFARMDGYNDNTPERSRRRRFERDLQSLEELGLHLQREKNGTEFTFYRIDRSACLLPSLALSNEQRLVLHSVAQAYLKDGGDGPLASPLLTAVMKLQAGAARGALPARVPETVMRRSLARRPGEEKRLEAILDARVAQRFVSFKYRDRGGKTSTRKVAPYALVTRRGGWYLVGHDADRGDVRTFRLARMAGAVKRANPRARGPEYMVPSGFVPESAFSSESFGAGDGAFTGVQIRFDADVAFVVQNDFEGIYELVPAADGSVVLHLPQAYPAELMRYLGEFPGHWQVLAPAPLREFVVQRLRESLQALGVKP